VLPIWLQETLTASVLVPILHLIRSLLIFTAGGGTVVGYSDDDCGVQSEIYFTPSTSGDYDIQINEFNCLTNSTCMDMVVELTAIGGGVGCSSSGTNYPSGTFNPTTSWQVASTLIYAGEYLIIQRCCRHCLRMVIMRC
jgi:hypothetical protein